MMGIPTSYKAAFLIVLVVLGYFGLRTVFRGGDTQAGLEDSASDEQFTVLASQISESPWQEIVNIRGRTKAFRKVAVRAETPGVVAQTPTSIGAEVKEGDLLCQIKVGARQSQVDQAKAALAKARIDYNAANELKKEGLGSANSLATAKASLDLAQAGVLQAELSLEHTYIAAPFDGIFDQRMAEAGDFLSVGDPCGVVIQQSPFLVVGAVSEREVGKIKKGDRGIASLATGETIEGVIRFVATASDAATRTFDVELEIPNEKSTLRDGVTAQFRVFADRRNAHLLPRSSLILNDDGVIGVRLVNEMGDVSFAAVTLLGESASGVYVDGLDGTISIITRGQEYVSTGQRVTVTYTATKAVSAQQTEQDSRLYNDDVVN